MSEDTSEPGDSPGATGPGATGPGATGPAPIVTSRRALMVGAVGASAIISIRPALAQTNASVLTCTIPVTDPARAGSYIAADGKLVPAGTPGSFAPAGRAFRSEEVKRALSGGQLPGTDYQRSRAYTNYIRRLQSGTSGFTCFASLQMPRG